MPAADFMVRILSEQRLDTPIVFVAHGARYRQVADVVRTPLYPDGRAVEAACASHPRCHFLNLRYAFSRDWTTHHIRFEAAGGEDWNAYANRLVARTLADFITVHHLL
jgi:hypothetical protein